MNNVIYFFNIFLLLIFCFSYLGNILFVCYCVLVCVVLELFLYFNMLKSFVIICNDSCDFEVMICS